MQKFSMSCPQSHETREIRYSLFHRAPNFFVLLSLLIHRGPAELFKKFPVPKTYARQNETIYEANKLGRKYQCD